MSNRWLLSLTAAFFCVPFAAHAIDWQTLFWRADQRGAEALQHGHPGEAADLFTDPAWHGAALYRAGQYRAAADLFQAQKDARSQYNLGNALAEQHQYAAAKAAYERALAQAPNDQDAAYNRDLMEKLLKQQSPKHSNTPQHSGSNQASSEPQQSSAENDTSPKQQSSQSSQQNPKSQQTAAEQPHAENGGHQTAGQKTEQTPEAQARTRAERATKQWLQQIPDDPGGLLKQKFLRDYERRQAER